MWTPRDLGFPESFESFRVAQEEVLEHAITTEKRFVGIGAPPGVGKSGIAYGLARLLGGRTVILTANLGLERQYLETHFLGLVGIRGRANYPCWEGGTCEDGGRLGCGDKEGCPYLGAYKAQQESSIVVTNYAYWLAVHDKGQGIRAPDMLICDEAGEAPDWLSRSLDFTISERECREAKCKLDPKPGDECDEWIKWSTRLECAALIAYDLVRVRASHTKSTAASRDLRHAESFVDRTRKLSRLDDNWVVTREEGDDEGRVWKFECVWPGRYRERLFRNIPRVVLMSATLRPKTLGLLGIARDDCDFREWGRQFPAANGPVIYVPTTRVNHKISDKNEAKWMARIAEILARRGDRRGLIHTVSYARAKRISEAVRKELDGRIILNGAADPDTQTAREAFDRFIKGAADAVLCSPSFSTGWDFAGRSAEYQIIAKLPLPDPRSKVMQARIANDPTYCDYLAAQDLVQSCGRVVRSETDRGETIIIDDSWQWFRAKAADHLPRWFKVRKEYSLPAPLAKL